MPYPGNLWAPKPHLLDVRTEGCHSSLSWVLRTQFTSCGSARGDKNCTNLYALPPAPLSSQEFPTSSYVIIGPEGSGLCSLSCQDVHLLLISSGFIMAHSQ